MPSTYTVNLGIEKPATGEQSGTWGDTTNVNFDILDQAVNGAARVTLTSAASSGSPNTLAITNGATSDGRNKWVEFYSSSDLGGNVFVQLDPNDAEKIVFVRNSLGGSQSLILFQGTYNAGRDLEIPAGMDMVVKFDGGGATATTTNVFQQLRTEALNIAGDGATVTGIKDEDNMASNSATKLATQQSIKAYVDSQVGTVDTLSEILANGNTTGGSDIVVSANDVISLDDGTNALPSLTTTGDLNTGLYFPAADTVGISTGGTQRVNVNSTGVDITGELSLDTRVTIDGGAGNGSIELGGGAGGFIDFKEPLSEDFNGRIIYNDANGFILGGNTGIPVKLAYGGVGPSNVKLATTSAGVAITGGFTATDGSTITTNDNTTNLELRSTDADANIGPRLDLYRESASPAANDFIGDVRYLGKNDADQTIEYANLEAKIIDETDGSEDGQLDIRTVVAGTGRSRLFLKSDELAVNSGAQDIDFRVVSQNQQNMLFVDAANNRVAIGTNGPASIFEVRGTDSTLGNFVSTSVSPSTGARIKLTHSKTGADGDNAGYIDFNSTNSDGNTHLVSRIQSDITDITAGTEDGRLRLFNFVDGTSIEMLRMASSSVFNEGGHDIDFRVEGADDPYMIFVDAFNNRVGINISNPQARLSVLEDNVLGSTVGDYRRLVRLEQETGNQQQLDVIAIRTAAGSDWTTQGIRLQSLVDSTEQAYIQWNGANTQNGLELGTGGGSGGYLDASIKPRISIKSATEVVFNEGGDDYNFRVEGASNKTHGLYYDAGLNQTFFGGATSALATGFVSLGGIKFSNGSATGGAFLSWDNEGSETEQSLIGYWYDGSSYRNRFRVAGNTLETVVNGSGDNIDFRVASDAKPHMFFVDAAANKVGINQSSPTANLDVYATAADADGVLRVYQNVATGNPTVKILQRGEGGSQNTNQGLLIDIAGHNQGLGYIINTSVTNSNVNSGVAISPFSVKGIGTFQFRQGGVINENGADSDFRVESVDNANMLVVDASDNIVNIGAAANSNQTTLNVGGGITISSAMDDDNLVTSIDSPLSAKEGGQIIATYGLQGTMRSATDIILEYRATTWKSYAWEVHVSNTFGYCIVRAGGYSNGNNPTGTTVDLINGTNPLSAASQVNQNNQYVRLKLDSAGAGVHTSIRVVYSQHGADGVPKANRLFFTADY